MQKTKRLMQIPAFVLLFIRLVNNQPFGAFRGFTFRDCNIGVRYIS